MEADRAGEIYNVGSQNRISVLGLADKVRELTGSTSEVTFIPYDEVYGQGIEDMIHRIPSLEKVRAAIGWEPQRTLDDILSDVVEYVRANG
jgi:UDP-glucose 4-epimerase